MLEDLIVSLSYPQDPQLSPDGRWVAYVATPYGQKGEHPEGSIWLVAVDGDTAARQFTFGSGRDEHPRWAPDSQRLAFLSDRAQPGVKGLYLVRLTGGEARPLVQRKRSITACAWSPDGRTIAFLAPDDPTADEERRKAERDDADVYGQNWRYNRLHLVDVTSGSVRTLPTGDVHVAEITWSPDGTQLAYVTWPTPELEMSRLAEIRRIGADGTGDALITRPPGGTAQPRWVAGDYVLFYGEHDLLPQGSLSVFAVPAAGGKPRVIGTTVDEAACSTAVDARPGAPRAVLTVAQGLSSRLEWVDPASGARTPLYAPAEGDLTAASVQHVGGEARLALVQSSGHQPPEIYAGTPATLRRRSDHHAPLREFRVGTQEPFHWTAPDGLSIDGVLIRPVDAGDGPYPFVVLPHGGPYGRWSMSWNLNPHRWGPWLAAHGYAVLLPNYRGGLGRGHSFAVMARGNVGIGDFQDVMAGVDAAIERGIADPDRLGIGGWSQGGFMTAWAVTQTHRFKAGVMGAGPSDWGMMVMTSDLPTFEAVLAGSRPWDGVGPHRAAEISPISYAANVQTPVLILHGKNDERVPVSQAVGFERALRERGVPVELVTYPREPHGIREQAHQRDILRRVVAWFDRWLKGD